MSPLLQEFYDEMYLAINGKQPVWFLHSGGLCLNLKMFLSYKNVNSDDSEATRWELKQQFIQLKLSSTIPFNKDKKDFELENDRFNNLKRVEWINDHNSKSIRPDTNKCCIDTPFECGCTFGQCAKGLIY